MPNVNFQPSSFNSWHSANLPLFNEPIDTSVNSAEINATDKTTHADSNLLSSTPQKLLKSECLYLIYNTSSSFGELSNNLWDKLSGKSLNPDLKESTQAIHATIESEITDFKNKYDAEIKQMSTTNWKDYISDLSKKIANNPQSEELQEKWKSIAEFRGAAVRLQNKLTGLAASAVGIEHTKWGAFGTPGNGSDIDNTYTSDPNIPQVDQMMVKFFADTLYTYIFGADTLSGIQLDLETYLEHPGSAWDTEKEISGSSINQFYYLELSMGELQMRNACESDAEWNAYKASRIRKFSDPLKEVLEKIFKEVELFYKSVQINILCEVLKKYNNIETDPYQKNEIMQSEDGLAKLHNAARQAVENSIGLGPQGKAHSPEFLDKAYKQAVKRADAIYKCPRLMKLSELMDQDVTELNNLLKSDLPASKKTEKKDEIELRLAARARLRNSFFDESYLTSGAYNIVCDREGGQLSKRRDDENLRLLETARLTSNVLDFPIVSRKFRSRATPIEHVNSARENSAKLYHENHSKHQNPSPDKTEEEVYKEKVDIAINSSKYAERTTSSSLEALKMMQKKINELKSSSPDSVELDLLQQEIEQTQIKISNLHKKAGGLEKCKRQTEINDTTTKKCLENVLIPKLPSEIDLKVALELMTKLLSGTNLEEDALKLVTKLFPDIDAHEARELMSKLLPEIRFEEALELMTKLSAKIHLENVLDIAIDKVQAMFQSGGKYFDQEISPIDKYNLYLSHLELLIFKPLNIFTKEYQAVDEIINSTKTQLEKELKKDSDEKKLFDILSPADQYSLVMDAKKKLNNPSPSPKAIAKMAINLLKKSLTEVDAPLSMPQKVKENITAKFASLRQKEVETNYSNTNPSPNSFSISPRIKAARKKLWEKAGNAVVGTSGNAEIDAILRAKAGLPRIGDAQVQDLHTASKESEMMQELGLGTVHEIDNYSDEIEKISDTIFELTQASGLIATPAQAPGINISALWQQTDLRSINLATR